MAACLLSTLFGILILTNYKVTKSSYGVVSYYGFTGVIILWLVVSVIILMDCTGIKIGCFTAVLSLVKLHVSCKLTCECLLKYHVSSYANFLFP